MKYIPEILGTIFILVLLAGILLLTFGENNRQC